MTKVDREASGISYDRCVQYTFFMKKIERKNKGKNIEQENPKKGNIEGNIKWLVGVDEVGRGPLAGPVAVCACAIPYHKNVKESYKKFLRMHEKEIKLLTLPSLHMRDSKKLSAFQREQWKEFLKRSHAFFAYTTASAKEIDTKGIAVCIKKLIQKNLESILKKHTATSSEILIVLDGGLKAPKNFLMQQTIIKGDEKEMVISFASIFAKVTRDEYMKKISIKNDFRDYKFEIHKGYGTAAHRNLIGRLGLSSLHRRSFCTRIVTEPKI